jgi:hypothetical protein
MAIPLSPIEHAATAIDAVCSCAYAIDPGNVRIYFDPKTVRRGALAPRSLLKSPGPSGSLRPYSDR